jgi:hypothetical protein
VGDAVEGIILERSRSVSEGESPSQAEVEKAEDRPKLNLYSLQGKVLFLNLKSFCPIFILMDLSSKLGIIVKESRNIFFWQKIFK